MSARQVIDLSMDDDEESVISFPVHHQNRGATNNHGHHRRHRGTPTTSVTTTRTTPVIELLDDDSDDSPIVSHLQQKHKENATMLDSKLPAKPRASAASAATTTTTLTTTSAPSRSSGLRPPHQSRSLVRQGQSTALRPVQMHNTQQQQQQQQTDSKRPAKPKAASASAAATASAGATVIDVTSQTLGSQPPAAAAAPVPNPPHATTPVEHVLEVFPDVDRNYLERLLQKYSGNTAMVVSILAEESSSYPKSKATHASSSPFVVGGDGSGGVTVHTTDSYHRDKRQRKIASYTYDFMSSSSFEPTYPYIQEARTKLYHEFPFVSSNGITKLLKRHSNHYAICHHAICQAIVGGPMFKDDDDRQEEYYRLFKSAKAGVHLTQDQHSRLMVGRRRTTVLHPRKMKSSSQTALAAAVTTSNAILLQEIDYVQDKEQEWVRHVEMLVQRKQNRADAIKMGATMECPCCCCDVTLDEMIACREEGHLFCVDCLRRYAENQIFTLGSFGIHRQTKRPATDLMCMHSDGCCSSFDVAHLRKALPEKIMAKYDELQFHAAVNAAGLELFACPKCNYQAELPQTQMIFHCPVAECGQETCRKCGEPAHIPLKCSEVEKQRETKGRLKVEEAISNAKIRTCPKPGCGKKFVKEGTGCNKMTCACGAFSCYVCRALIPPSVSYKHFCQTPHCDHSKCDKCSLYSNVEEDDKRAMREAGIETAEAVRAESLVSASGTQSGVASMKLPSEVRVDVESLLKEVPAVQGAARRR